MAFLFQPPAAPEGYEYVVRDQNYVLVPKSELTADICPATGRTWSEEARLYNIRNAPDGKEIAEPGDPFYQTAESMKNRGNELKGVGSSGLAFFNQLSSSSESKGPSLADTLAKIKNGEANADVSSALGNISSVSGSLPGNVNEGLAASQASIAEKISAAQADLPKLMAIAQANMDLTTKLAVAQGRAPTEAELKAASGALAVFQDGPTLLQSKARALSSEIVAEGAAFGVDVPKDITEASGAISDLTDTSKITEAAQTTGSAISSSIGEVPTPTIPNPLYVAGDDTQPETIPNPEYETYAANPANAEKVGLFQNILNKITNFTSSLTSDFIALEQTQQTAVAGGVEDLKAFAFAAQLSQPATGVLGAAKSLSVNPTAFDPEEIKKALSGAANLGAAIDTAAYSGTKDEDLTYTGDDGIVWDRVNTERERRGLPGLVSLGAPRPDEPPLVPRGATPPKPPNESVKTENEFKDPPPKIVPKTAVFNKKPSDKVSKDFTESYFKIYSQWKDALDASRNILPKAAEDWFGDTIPGGYIALRDKRRAIESDKPDPSTRSAEEKKTIEEQTKWKTIFTEKSTQFQQATYFRARHNEVADAYNLVRKAYISDANYAGLPKIVEDVVLKDEGPKDWKIRIPTPTYLSYADFLNNKPYQTPINPSILET